MKYLATAPNRWFFLIILLMAMILMCTSYNPLVALTARLFANLPQ